MHFKRQSFNSCSLFCLLWHLWITWLISTNAQAQNLKCSFHYEEFGWPDAVEKCMSEESELMCYSDRKEMMTIVRAFISGLIIQTNVKIWLMSTNCEEFEETHRMDVCLYLKVNITDDGRVWPFFQKKCEETLPFVCCRRESGAFSPSTVTELPISTHKATTQSETSLLSTTTPMTTTAFRTPQESTSIFITPKITSSTLITGTNTVTGLQGSTSTSPRTEKFSTATSSTAEKSTTVTFRITDKPSTITSSTTENFSIPTSRTMEKSSTSTSTSSVFQTSSMSTYKSTTPALTTSTASHPAFCKATIRRGIDWPNAALGSEIFKSCPGNAIGKAKWTCNTYGSWVPGNPDMNNCQSVSVLEIKQNYYSMPTNYTIDEIDKILNNESDVYGRDLVDIVSITSSLPDMLFEETVSLSDQKRWNIVANSVNKTASIIDNIVSLKVAWNDLSQEDTVQTGSSILKMVEDFGILLADAMFENNTHNIFTKYIAMQVLRAPAGSSLSIPKEQENFQNFGESIVLSKGYEAQLDPNDGNLTAVFARYTQMNHILLSSRTNEKKKKESVLNSAVVSAVVSQGRSAVPISTEAEIFVRYLVAEPNDTACVFWNLDRNDWDPTGCKLEFSNETHSVCMCDHLTNFAVLMDFQDIIDDVESLPFFYITVIGCSISIVCLLLCVAVFTCYSYVSRNVWGLRYTIHRNLCLTLFIANLLLVTGLNRTNNQMICSIMAGLLHYFFLSAFSWMLLEGLHIYLLLVVVFASKRSHWEKYYIFGYGFPLLVVSITAISRPGGYGTEKVCWLSVENGVIWSFLGPVAFVLTVNCCALILAQWKASKMSVKDDNVTLIKRWLRVTLILFPILGITWLFGFFYVGKHYKIAAYLFALLNSLQGFCIFICHCVMDTKARNMVLNSLKRKQASVATESSGTQKKLKTMKKKHSADELTPVEDTNLNTMKVFQSVKTNPLKKKWSEWPRPWTFYFDFRVNQNNKYDDLQGSDTDVPKAVILQWNVVRKTDSV